MTDPRTALTTLITEHSALTGARADRLADKIAAEWLPAVRREALREAAQAWQTGQWADAPRCSDRVRERIANGQFVLDWLRARADRQVGGEHG